LFRALQGVGGAALFATGTPLLRAEFSGAAWPGRWAPSAPRSGAPAPSGRWSAGC